jgi:hypothetical protein
MKTNKKNAFSCCLSQLCGEEEWRLAAGVQQYRGFCVVARKSMPTHDPSHGMVADSMAWCMKYCSLHWRAACAFRNSF